MTANAKLMGVVIMAAFLPRSAEKVPLLRSPIERLVMFFIRQIERNG